MGVVLSRFKTKQSTKEILEEIDKNLKCIEEFRQDTQERQKRVAKRLLVITVLVYCIALLAFFVLAAVQEKKIHFIVGLVTYTVLTWVFRRVLMWFYNRQLENNEEKSTELRKKKKKILEEVMDTETYKVAKEILDRFGDKDTQKPPPLEISTFHTPAPLSKQLNNSGMELRQRRPDPRIIQPKMPVPLNVQGTPMNAQGFQRIPDSGKVIQRPPQTNVGYGPVRNLPRPILPRERGVLDRLLDLFVGDGPNQRYALICRHCGGHNGMALQEEFEYIAFYCCYCYRENPPRKQRPIAPRLPVPVPPPPEQPLPHEQHSDDSGEGRQEKDSEIKTETDSCIAEEKLNASLDEETTNSKMEVDDTREGINVSPEDGGQDLENLR